MNGLVNSMNRLGGFDYDEDGGSNNMSEDDDDVRITTKLPIRNEYYGSNKYRRRNNRKKKNNGITYIVPEKFRDYHARPEIDFLVTNHIPSPDAIHHLSEYLHACMTMIENTVYRNLVPNTPPASPSSNISTTSSSSSSINNESIIVLKDKITDYHIRNRSSLSQDHRDIIWAVQCRLSVMTFKGKTVFGAFDPESDLATKYPLLITTLSISEYRLSHLWRAIQVILSKINNIRYGKEVHEYIQLLEACCGRFLFMNEPKKKFIDYHIFTKHHATTTKTFTINSAFITDTEKIFYGIYESYLPSVCLLKYPVIEYKSSMETTEDKERGIVITKSSLFLENEDVAHMLTWLNLVSSGTLREFVEKDLLNGVCSGNLYIGEKERFEDQEKFPNPAPYNVICKYRPECIDELVKWIYKEPVTYILDKTKKKYEKAISARTKSREKNNSNKNVVDDSIFIDLEFDTLTMGILVNFFKATFNGSSINEYVITMPYLDSEKFLIRQCLKPQVYDDSIGGKSVQVVLSIPKILQVSREYYLVLPREKMLILYPTLMETFAGWVMYICESDEFNGILKSGNIDLIHTYSLLLPRRSEQKKEGILKSRHDKRSKEKEKVFIMPDYMIIGKSETVGLNNNNTSVACL
jgi:hypothetical protein